MFIDDKIENNYNSFYSDNTKIENGNINKLTSNSNIKLQFNDNGSNKYPAKSNYYKFKRVFYTNNFLERNYKKR